MSGFIKCSALTKSFDGAVAYVRKDQIVSIVVDEEMVYFNTTDDNTCFYTEYTSSEEATMMAEKVARLLAGEGYGG